MDDILEKIQHCFEHDKVLYSRHAKFEMEDEKFGIIFDNDIDHAIADGVIIEEYPEDKPFPSVLILGETAVCRPIHLVCAYDGNEDTTIIVTAYQPDPEQWYQNRERRKI